MDALPDPLTARWPRSTGRSTLRPVESGDLDAMLAYRRLPEVCRYLTHDPLDRDGVMARIEMRLTGIDPTPGRLVRGASVVVDGRVVGDGMMRTQRDDEGRVQFWIGYALHPDVWGQGVATEVARELRAVGHELGLAVWADAYADNTASHRVLEKAGLTLHHRHHDDGRPTLVYTDAPGTR